MAKDCESCRLFAASTNMELRLSNRKESFRVGLFVVLMTLLGATVFMISGSTKLFEERYTLNGSWKDVAGLKEGATVRLAGWDVGEVIKIQFAEEQKYDWT